MSNSITAQYPSDIDDSLETEKSLGDWFQAIKRRKISVFLTIISLTVLTAIIAFSIPAKYKSSGTIL